MRIVKPGCMTIDTASKLKGMVIRAVIEQDGHVHYLFQPRGSNEDGERLLAFRLTVERLEKPEYIEIDPPLSLLGTIAEDTATGIKGMAVDLAYHESGCVHVGIQPEGTNKKGEIISPMEVDILRLKGPGVPKLTKKEQEAHRAEKPSPGTVNIIRRIA